MECYLLEPCGDAVIGYFVMVLLAIILIGFLTGGGLGRGGYPGI